MKQLPCTQKINPVLQHILDLAVVLIILIIGWVYTHGIEQVLDIQLSDESNYLHRGILIPSEFPSAQWAPLYALWYYVLSFVQPDTVELYFLNYKLMTVLPPLMLFVALRAYSVSRILSFVLSLGFLFSSANFPTWPKVSHFAVIFLLGGFFLCSFFRDRRYQVCALTIAAIITSYIRPEYFLAFILLGVIFTWVTFARFRYTHSLRSTVPFVIVAILCLSLIAWLGLPVGSGDRNMMAFGQHYARNWVRWHNDERNPYTDYKTIIAEDFGDSDSVFEAVLTNPAAVTRHVVQNLQRLPIELKFMFISTFPPNCPANIGLKLGLLVLLVGGIAHIRKKEIIDCRDRVVENWAFLRFHMVLLLVVLLPVAISILLIAPRKHYLYILGFMLVFGFSVLVFRKMNRRMTHSGYSTLALFCIMVLLTARPLSILAGQLPPRDLITSKFLHSIGVMVPQKNLSTIRFLRSLGITVPVDILEAQGCYGIYVGSNYRRVLQYEKKAPLKDFLENRSIDIIVMSDGFSRDTRFRDDPEWHAFTNDPSCFGFEQKAIPNVLGWILFVKEDIIHATRTNTEKRVDLIWD